MSLFNVELGLINKLSSNGLNSILERNVAPTRTNCFGAFSKAAAELNDESSQFFIDESDLWNEDDSDAFEPVKINKSKKNSPEAKDKSSNDSFKQNEPEEEKISSPVDTHQQETTKPSPEEEEDDVQDNLNFDLADEQSNNENEISFGLVDESYDNIVLEDSSDTIPASPTFHLSSKSAKKVVEPSKADESDKKCTLEVGDCVKDDSNTFCEFELNDSNKKDGSGDACNFEVCDTSVEKTTEEEKSSFCVPKGVVNPLGMGQNTDQWLTTLLQNEAFSNVSWETSEEKLQNNLTFLNKSYVEILEKVMSAFENLPLELLKQFPEFDVDVFTTLRTTRKRIKAIAIKTENLLKRRHSESKNCEKSWDGSETEVRRNFSDLVSPFGESGNKFSFSAKQQLNPDNKTKANLSVLSPPVLLGGKQTKLNFPVLNSPNLGTLSDIEISNSSTPLPNRQTDSVPGKSDLSVIDYTDVLYKTPGKNDRNSRFQTNMRNDSATGEFDGMNFPHSEEILKKFRQKFGLKTFRPNQLQAINATLLGHDCFVLMPTGGGKSLCYQLPALVSRGVTVVISPLRSLILDQVTKLLNLDIAAAHLSGDMKESEAMSVYMKLNQPEPKIKLLYVTPEKVGASSALRGCLQGLYRRQMLARFVIDEAHCVSEWGHDFRPDYKKLRELRENFPDVKIMALTATATPRVRTDILQQLKVANPKWFLSSFNRSNLTYSVRDKTGKKTIKEIASMIQNEFKKDSGVIYCLSRKECEAVAKDLKNFGITAVAYHAGLKDEERSRVQKMWMNDKAKVVCATIAFGMGIDKLDVRFVIHYSLPKSIEGYYQESGRAGRDGEKATCVLFYSYKDKHRLLKLINMDQSMGTREARKIHIDNLYRVVAFAENKTDCRRAIQLEYFGEKFDRRFCAEDRNTACDNCLGQGLYETVDVTTESQAIVASVKEICGTGGGRGSNYTMLHFVEVFRGSVMKKVTTEGHDKLPFFGMGKTWQRNDVERLFRKLIMEEFLKERLLVRDEQITVAYISYGRRGEELLNGNVTIMFEVRKRKGGAAQSVNVRTENRIDPAILEIQEKCYAELMDAIHEIASSVNCNPNAIMNVQALRAMSSTLPETEEEMLSINHVTTANFEKYGNVLLEITKKYSGQKKSVRAPEVPEADSFLKKFTKKSTNSEEDSPYFDVDVEFTGKGRGGGKRKRTYRKPQNSKRWKGSNGQTSARGGGAGRGNNKKGTDDGSGVRTVGGAKISALMELPTSKARGFDRPRVLLKNL